MTKTMFGVLTYPFYGRHSAHIRFTCLVWIAVVCRKFPTLYFAYLMFRIDAIYADFCNKIYFN